MVVAGRSVAWKFWLGNPGFRRRAIRARVWWGVECGVRVSLFWLREFVRERDSEVRVVGCCDGRLNFGVVACGQEEEEKVRSWCGLGFHSKLIGLRDPVEVISV